MLSLGCELRVGVKLKVAAFFTAEGSNRQTESGGLFRRGPKGLLRLALMPSPDEYTSIRAIRHEPLDHVPVALLARHE